MALQDFVTQFVLMQSQRVDVQRHVIVVRRGNFGIRFSLKVAIDLQPPGCQIVIVRKVIDKVLVDVYGSCGELLCGVQIILTSRE